MGPRNRADHVEGVADRRRPVAQRLVHRVLQGACPGLDDRDGGAEELHAEDVEALPAHVLRAHEDLATHAEQRGDGGGRDAVLARARLRDQPALLETARDQRLADRVVDLVRAGVEQVLALQVDPGAAEPSRETAREVQPRGSAGVFAEPLRELAPERGVARKARVGPLELQQLRHERLGDIPAAVLPEVAGRVRQSSRGG